MPQQDKSWELLQILDTASESSLEQDLGFLVHSSRDDLFGYLKQEQDNDYNLIDSLKLVVAWLEKKQVTDKNIQFYIIKNVCTALYFNRNPELPIENKDQIHQDLTSLYNSIRTNDLVLEAERNKFLSIISTFGKRAGQFSMNPLYRYLAYGALVSSPFVLTFIIKTLAGEDITPEDWAMSRAYSLFALEIGAGGMIAASAFHGLGFFNRTNPAKTENAYVAPPASVNRNHKKNSQSLRDEEVKPRASLN